MNRTALLQTIEPLIDPTPTVREALRKSLDKVLVEASSALPLKSAWQLTGSAKEELSIVIRDFYVQKDLSRLAAKWEPLRQLDAGLKENLRQDLIDLLRGQRPQYMGLPRIPFEEAQEDPVKYSTYIGRSMPMKDAQSLAAKWEPRRKLDADLKKSVRQDLIDLLHRRRPQYKGFVPILLKEAQEDAVNYGVYVERSMPTADAKKLLKAWNRSLKPVPSKRSQIVAHLLKLLDSNAAQLARARRVA